MKTEIELYGDHFMRVEEHEAALQAEREKAEKVKRQGDAAERELAAAHKKSAAPGEKSANESPRNSALRAGYQPSNPIWQTSLDGQRPKTSRP